MGASRSGGDQCPELGLSIDEMGLTHGVVDVGPDTRGFS